MSISVEEGAQTGWGGFVLGCSLAGWREQRKVVRVVQVLDAQAAWAELVQRRAEGRAADNGGEFQAQRTIHTADEERQDRTVPRWTSLRTVVTSFYQAMLGGA